jgi:hypothetical protein
MGESTCRASRAASAPVEGKEERLEERAHEGPSTRRFTELKVLPTESAMSRTRARSPRSSSAGGAAASTPKARASSSSVRTRGQTTLGTSLA